MTWRARLQAALVAALAAIAALCWLAAIVERNRP